MQSSDVPSAEAVLRHHPAFCRLALPIRDSRGIWRREVPDTTVTIESGASQLSAEQRDTGFALPTGRDLRLILLHVCELGLLADGAPLEVGAAPIDFARTLLPGAGDAALAAMAAQIECVMAARIMVSLDGATALAMFDARGRTRGASPAWRPVVRLNSKFFAQLQERPVALERRVAERLADAPLAFDAYAWLQHRLPEITAGTSTFSPWDELMGRFAQADQELAAFRDAFEQALRQVSELCPSLSLVIREQGVECRVTARRAPPVREEVAAPPAPLPATVAAAEELPDEEDEIELQIEAEIASAPDAPLIEESRQFDQTGRGDQTGRADQAGRADQSGRGEQNGRAAYEDTRPRQSISLKSPLTGLHPVVWLQRANGRESPLLEVTPGGRYDADAVTVLALEPMILQIAGGLNARDFERVSAWANANRDLIDDFWEGDVTSFDDISKRVKKVPPPGWR